MQTKYIYIAGLLDGEGYLGLGKWNQERYKYKYTYKTRIIIANCNLKLLEWIKNNFGGYISKKKIKKKNWTQGYNLQIGNIQNWLPKVVPYLVGKKQKAILLLEAQELLNQRKKKTNSAGKLYLERLEEIYLLLKEKEWLL